MRWVSYTRSISSRIGEENPANTIAEQNANIEQYLKNKGYRISEKYSDRKRSAEAADGFDRMVQDGMTQKFDAVAVDSIFRFGKTLPFAIEVLQKTFYPVGIQFAVVEDDFCSTDRTADEVEQYFKEKAMVFCCGHKRSVGKFSHCYSGYYREQAVNSRVARAIKTVFTALEVVNQGMQEKKSITLQCVDVDDLKKQAEMIRAEQIKLYESYADGILTRNEYLEKKKGLGEKLADLQEKIRIEEEEQETADELDEEIRSLTKQASQKTYIGGLTKECVDAFVSMVYLYDDQTMKVEFNCEDVIRRALEKYGA